MTRHYPDLRSASYWLNQISYAARPIRSTTQIWVVTRYQYGISALVSEMSFVGETSGGIAKCWLFSQAIWPLSVPIKRVSFPRTKQTVRNNEVSVKLGLTAVHYLFHTKW